MNFKYKLYKKCDVNKHCFHCLNSCVGEWLSLYESNFWCKEMCDMSAEFCEFLKDISINPKLF